MNRATSILLLLLPLLAACGRPAARNSEFTIVTSFYPMYIMAKNIARDIPGVRVVNLTASSTGCLHDYQLTPTDMQTLAAADVFIVNGGGMEPFADKISEAYPDLRVIDASQEQGFLSGNPSPPYAPPTRALRQANSSWFWYTEPSGPPVKPVTAYVQSTANSSAPTSPRHRTGANSNTNDTVCVINTCTMDFREPTFCLSIGAFMDPHQWVSIGGNRLQLLTVTDSLCVLDNARAAAYRANTAAYDQRLATLQMRLHGIVGNPPPQHALVLHRTLDWFIAELGLGNLIFPLKDSEAGPTTGELAEIISRIRGEQITHLIIDQPFSLRAAEMIARETGVKIHVIDPCVTGSDDPDAYINAMERNLEVLKEALR